MGLGFRFTINDFQIYVSGFRVHGFRLKGYFLRFKLAGPDRPCGFLVSGLECRANNFRFEV